MIKARFIPHGCADAFYTKVQPGLMASLSNLVPSADSEDHWVARPAAQLLPNSILLNSSGIASAQVILGTKIYGWMPMISGPYAGFDIPFCYDIPGAAFISISGITALNIPASLPATGGYAPPHAEIIGIFIVLTHGGFSGVGTNFFGMINSANSTTLSYNSYQINVGFGGTPLPAVPTWVTQFNGRAYFLVNPVNFPPAAVFSDVFSPATFFAGPLVVAPYNNALTFGGNLTLTCGGTVSFDNQLGGQTQALIVFQGHNNMWQVVGDPAVTTPAVANINQGALEINSLNIATGTDAPNTLCQTPKGLMFVAPDGLRLIDFQAHVSDPLGFEGKGIAVPFTSSATPSRMCAACNATTIRISTINGTIPNVPQQEWAYNLTDDTWHGPHTFPIGLITFYGTSYIATSIGIQGFWQTDIEPNSSSNYVENGAQLQCVYQTCLFSPRDSMTEMSMVASVFYQSYGPGTTTYTITALDRTLTPLPGSPVTLTFTGQQTLWNQFAWGFANWLGALSNMAATQIPWTAPIIFDKVSILIQVPAGPGLRLGDIVMEIDEEAYTVQMS